MSAINSGRRRPGIVLHLALLILAAHSAHSAPLQESDSTQVAEYDAAGATGCYYNFQHYQEGARIVTNEPCLNCTCHNRMLMCYLRVCPFTKAIGQDCTVEKRPDQCCPVITCPEVPVQLLTSTSTTSSPSQSSSTEVGKLESSELGFPDTYGCNVEDRFYADGAQLPLDAANPCELCYCIRNKTTCLMQQCTLAVAGCKPVYQPGICCPVKYNCEYDEEYEAMAGTTPGLIMTTTLAPHATAPKCQYDNRIYEDGELIYTIQPCQHCYCFHGEIVCAVQECGKPMEAHGRNCTALPPQDGECCPTTYQCDDALGETVTALPGSKKDPEFFPGADNVIPEQVPITEKSETELSSENDVPEAETTKSSISGIPFRDDDSKTSLELNTAQPHTSEPGSRKSEVVTSEINEISKWSENTEASASRTTSPETPSRIGEKNDIVNESLSGTETSESTEIQETSTDTNIIQSEISSEKVDNHETNNQESPNVILTTPWNQEIEKLTNPPVTETYTEKNQIVSDSTQRQTEESATSTSIRNEYTNESSSPIDGAPSREEPTTESLESVAIPVSAETRVEKKEPVSPETNEVMITENSTPSIGGSKEETVITTNTETSKVKVTNSDDLTSENPTSTVVEGSQPADNAQSTSILTDGILNQNIGDAEISTITSSDSPWNDSSSSDSSLNQDSNEQEQSNGVDSSEEPHGDTTNRVRESIPTQIPEKSESVEQGQSNISGQGTESSSSVDDLNVGNEVSVVTEMNINEEDSSKNILGEPEIPDQGPSGILIPERVPEHKAEDNDAIQDTEGTEAYNPSNSDMTFEVNNVHTDESEYGPTTYLPPNTSDETKRQPSTSIHKELPEHNLGSTEWPIPSSITPSDAEKTIEDSTDKILSVNESEVVKQQPISASNTLREETVDVTEANISAGSIDKDISAQTSSSELSSEETSGNDSENDIHGHISTSEYGSVAENSPSEPITTSYEGITNPEKVPESAINTITWTSEPQSITETMNRQDSTEKYYSPEILTSTSETPVAESESDRGEDAPGGPVTGDQSPNLEAETPANSIDIHSSTEISNAIIVGTHKPEIIPSELIGASESPAENTEQDHRDESNKSEVENKTVLNEIIKDEAEATTSPARYENEVLSSSETSVQVSSEESISDTEKTNELSTSIPKVENQFSQNVEGQNGDEQITPSSVTVRTESAMEHSESPVTLNSHLDEEPVETEDGNSNVTESELDITPPTIESTTTSRVGSLHGIPGEGNCLVDGQSYSNNSAIPPVNACQLTCRCVSSIVQCELVKCTPPPADVSNCVPVFTPEDLCCPMYTCETTSPAQLEVDNQMSDSHKQSLGGITAQPTDDDVVTSIVETTSVETALINETSGNLTESYSTVASATVPGSESHKDMSFVPLVGEGTQSSSASPEMTTITRETEAPEAMVEITSAPHEGDGSSASTAKSVLSETSDSSQTSTSDSSDDIHNDISETSQSSVAESAVPESTNGPIEMSSSTTEASSYPEQNSVSDSNETKLDSTESSPPGINDETHSTSNADHSTGTHDVESSQNTVASISSSESVTESSSQANLETSTWTYDYQSSSAALPSQSPTTRSDLGEQEPTYSANSNEITTPPTLNDHSQDEYAVSNTSSEVTTDHHFTSSEEPSSDDSNKLDELIPGGVLNSSSDNGTEPAPDSSQHDSEVSGMNKDESSVTKLSSDADKEIYSTMSSISEEPSNGLMNNEASQEVTSEEPTFVIGSEGQSYQSTEEQSKLESDRPTSEISHETTASVFDQQQNAEISSTQSPVNETFDESGNLDEKILPEEPVKSSEEDVTEMSSGPISDNSEHIKFDTEHPHVPMSTTENAHEIEEGSSALPSTTSEDTYMSHDSGSTIESVDKDQPEIHETTASNINLQVPEGSELPLVIKDAEIDKDEDSSSSTKGPEQEHSSSSGLPDVEKDSAEYGSGVESVTEDAREEITSHFSSTSVGSSSTVSPTIEESTEHASDESMIPTSDEKDREPGSIAPEVSSEETPHEMVMETVHVTTPKLSEDSSSESNSLTTYDPSSHASPELSTKGTISTSSAGSSDLTNPQDDHYHVDSQHTDEPILSTPHEEEEHRPELYTTTAHPDASKPHTRPEYPDQHVPETDDESIFPPEGADIKDPYDTSDPETEDYDDQAVYGPGTCRYGGKIYMSAQQIPRDDACDFCFCFRSDIICLQQSCPPPIPGCHEEPIGGFCCPRYECPVSMATSLNITTTTSTTTTTIPPHFLSHAYRGNASRGGCLISGRAYRVGEEIKSKSGPCRNCSCGDNGKMDCEPKACSASPMLKEMIAHAAARKRRRRAIHS